MSVFDKEVCSFCNTEKRGCIKLYDGKICIHCLKEHGYTIDDTVSFIIKKTTVNDCG